PRRHHGRRQDHRARLATLAHRPAPRPRLFETGRAATGQSRGRLPRPDRPRAAGGVATMRQILGYTAMLLRAYTRDWVALFFGFFFPLIFMSLFGVLNFGSFGHVGVGVADEAGNADSAQLVSSFSKIETLQIHKGARADELAALDKGDRDIVLVIPSDFRLAPVQQGQTAPTLTMYQSSARAQQ